MADKTSEEAKRRLREALAHVERAALLAGVPLDLDGLDAISEHIARMDGPASGTADPASVSRAAEILVKRYGQGAILRAQQLAARLGNDEVSEKVLAEVIRLCLDQDRESA